MPTLEIAPPPGSTQDNRTPRAACQFANGFQFAAAGESQDALAPRDFSMVARTADAIDHWYWGKIIHDMAGFKQKKPKVVVDWCHEDDEIIGFVDQFVAGNDGLNLSGQLTPVFAEDRAAEIIAKHARGVPYEASIDWTGPARIEFVPEGMSVTVNGRGFAGPGYVVREWSIQAVAICPHGADGNTSTEMTRDTETINVTIFSSQQPSAKMSTQPPAATQHTEPTGQPVDSVAAVRSEISKFTKRFGAEAGLKHFEANTPYEQALETEFDALKSQHATQLAAKDEEIAALKQKLAAVPRGEKEPLTFTTPEEKQAAKQHSGPGAALAGVIRFSRN